MNSIIVLGVIDRLFNPGEEERLPISEVPERLRSALDRYFQYKSERGTFKDDAHREEYYHPIMDAAHELGLNVNIIPGLVILHGDDTVYAFTTSFPQGFVDVRMTKMMRGIQ